MSKYVLSSSKDRSIVTNKIKDMENTIVNYYSQKMKLEKARSDAEAYAKSKEVFLQNMSHEIRTPMNGVFGFLQLLEDSNTTSEQAELIN